jgi:hypothetical protein
MKNYLGVELVQNVLEVVSFNRFFRVKELQELLHELWSHVDFQGLHINGFVDNQLEEEFINSLEMGPCWVNFFFLVHTCLRKSEALLINVRQGSEYILFDHLHNFIKVGNDKGCNIFLVAKHLLKLIYCIKPLGLIKYSLEIVKFVPFP